MSIIENIFGCHSDRVNGCHLVGINQGCCKTHCSLHDPVRIIHPKLVTVLRLRRAFIIIRGWEMTVTLTSKFSWTEYSFHNEHFVQIFPSVYIYTSCFHLAKVHYYHRDYAEQWDFNEYERQNSHTSLQLSYLAKIEKSVL